MAFILASASPRRLDLLTQIGRKPDAVIPANIDEAAGPDEMPRALAGRLALAKAHAVAESHPNDVILAADTVVACGRRVLPKPDDRAEAEQCLRLLSGRRHRVYGGLVVIGPQGRQDRIVMTQVTFKRLSDREIDMYLASQEWGGKAGGYAIQGRAATFVKQINGSYTNVVGLCVYAVESLLSKYVGQSSRV